MTNKEVLKIIEEAKRDGRTVLKLRGKGLTSLPPEIGELTSLRIIQFDSNNLTSLPVEIAQLTEL